MAANPSIQLGTDGNWAIKEDNLLAYKKDGDRFFNKEFDFTRGSFATFVDKDGLIKTAGLQETNLVNNGDFSELGSELVTNGNFDTDSDWTKGTGWTIANNLANFNGLGFNAFRQNVGLITGKIYKVTFDLNITSGNVIFQLGGATNTFNSSATHTFYDTATANAAYSTFISLYSSTPSIFSIDNVSVKQVDPNDYWTLGTGWSFGDGKLIGDGAESNTFQSGVVQNGNTYKITLTAYNITTGYISVRVGSGGTENYQVNSNGTQTFIATADNGNLLLFRNQSNFNGSISNISVQEIQADTPRIDFTDDATGHLLLEPQSTNLITYSEDFSQWTTQGTITTTPSYGISPDGTKNSTRIFFSDGSQQIYKNFTSSSGVSGSIYIKGNSGEAIKFGVTGGEEIFTLNGDWQRLTTYSSSSTRLTINTYGAASTARDIEVWGAQVEEKSYSTSYIPTYGSTATRNQELCNNSGSVQDFNSEEGVLYAEIAALADDGTSRRISLSNGSTSNTVEILFQNTGTVSFQVKSGNSFQGGGTFNLTQTEFNKIAVKYKANDLALWVNGLERSADNSANTPIGLLELAFDDGGGGSDFYGKTKNLKVFKRAMSDGELYLLTVPQYQSYQEMATALNYTL